EGQAEPNPNQVAKSDLYVFGSAIQANHSERIAATKSGIPIFHRMDLLNRLVEENQFRFAIAGTHGKTSSTSMAGWLLLEMGLDPTIIAGGHPIYLADGCRNGAGQVAVFETDESDGSFLKTIESNRLILNIDRDHLNHYHTFEKLCSAFFDFAAGSTSPVVLNADDSQLVDFQIKLPQSVGFGTDPNIDLNNWNQFYFGEFVAESDELLVRYYQKGRLIENSNDTTIRLNIPGRHFAKNGLGVISLIHSQPSVQSKFHITQLIQILNRFEGVERRLQQIGSIQQIPVYDDYGHHPTEIRSVIDALHRRQLNPLCVVFQPHRYTRTLELSSEFAKALSLAEQVYLLPLYSAGEAEIENVSSNTILQKMKDKSNAKLIQADELTKILDLKPKAILFLGAGSVSSIGRQFVDRYLN
ncbi:MAG: hypothetical protein H3C43_09890, partial [Leptonema sp. (in: Bacteria)]|nr:hypothetical protein [Leptonema sp. (in: bacteria)]